MYELKYELLTEDENGNDVWEEMTVNVRERSAEDALWETRYYLEVERNATIRNLRNA